MKHFFIINPKAGQGESVDIEDEIMEQAGLRGLTLTSDQKRGVNLPEDYDVIIYRTRSVGDAERYVRYVCRSFGSGETFRFYACGGDGTLNEVVNGCAGFGFAEAACIPEGTGNDYIKNYPDAGDFRSIKAQMDGKAVMSDVIKYTVDGKEPRYCINMFNIGLDCNVVDLTMRTKKIPMVRGHLAYLLGVLITFIQKKGADLTIKCGDGFVFDGKLLLVAIANGMFCGGGVKGIPQAVTDDGLMDISIVKNATRLEFVKLYKEYKEGTHIDDKKAMEHFILRKCERAEITPRKGVMKLCTDGEISLAGHTVFEMVPSAVKFSVPAK